jgi:hypothetical protein
MMCCIRVLLIETGIELAALTGGDGSDSAGDGGDGIGDPTSHDEADVIDDDPLQQQMFEHLLIEDDSWWCIPEHAHDRLLRRSQNAFFCLFFVISLVRLISSWDRPGRRAEGSLQ